MNFVKSLLILADWEPKIYKITLDNTGAMSYNYIYEKYGGADFVKT